MAEIEAKFLMEDASEADRALDRLRLEGFEVEELAAVNLVDRYWDTRDWEILKEGWAYRWREADGQRKVCLKSVDVQNGAVQKREEIEDCVQDFPSNGHGLESGEVAENLSGLGVLQARELFEVRNHREVYLARKASGLELELAIDHTTVVAAEGEGKVGMGTLGFAELELELKEGSESSLRELAADLEEDLGILPSRLSKFERGLQTIGARIPAELRPEVKHLYGRKDLCELRKRRFKKDDLAEAYAARFLLDVFETFLLEEPRAWEGLDPEGVHQMRVATRRLRAGLRCLKPVLPSEEAKRLEHELKWVAKELGTVRDLDVMLENFSGYASEIPGEDDRCLADYRLHLMERRHEARKGLVRCLSSERYREFTADFAAFVCDLSSRSGRGRSSVSIAEAAGRAIGKYVKRVLREGRAITDESPDRAIHELRIDCKRMRYRIEVFRQVYGKKLKGIVAPLKKLQDVLGEFQDACVATHELREYAESVPMRDKKRDELIALGQLIHSQRMVAAEQRAAFSEVWTRFDQKGRRKQVLALLR